MTLADEQARLDDALEAARVAIPDATSSDALDELERHYTGRRSPAAAATEARTLSAHALLDPLRMT